MEELGRIFKWVIQLFLIMIFARGGLSQDSYPPVGLNALSDFDHLWLWTGKVQAGMVSSTDLSGGNMDMMGFQGEYQGEKVLAKLKGPGCIWRIWSAAPTGRIKFYLDHSLSPEIDCEFKKYLVGRCPGIENDFSVGRTANYLPIPFEKEIIITAPGFRFPAYYQVSYQAYDDSVSVKSFQKSRALSEPAFGLAKENWTNNPGRIKENNFISSQSRLKLLPGESATALTIKGPGIIRNFEIKDAQNSNDPLSKLWLKIYWEGASQPAVDAPIDAFFINSLNLKDKWPGGELKNFFIHAGKDGYACSFPMPFAKSARIVLENQGEEREILISALWEKREFLPANALRFYAFYRFQDYETLASKENTITTKTPIDPEANYLVLERKGKGHYLGCALFVKSIGTLWWGEGDEMTYIDGAKEPQIRGTGTEDEFNWSWGYMTHMSPVSGTLPVVPECKQSLVAQVIPSLRNKECDQIRGHNLAYRFRVSDYVPFESSIKVSYERLGWVWFNAHFPLYPGNLSQFRGDDFASIAYWYQLP